MFHQNGPRLGLCVWLLFGLFFGLNAAPALAYQVKVTAPNVQLKASPDPRTGSNAERIGPQRVLLLETAYAADGELWCRIQLANKRNGWLQARFIDPVLKDNLPMRLDDLPASLMFEHAQREVMYRSSLNQASLKNHLRSWTLVMEMAQIKQHWESTRQRLNFLDMSRRVGIKISATELSRQQQELRALEQKFQRALSEWQRN